MDHGPILDEIKRWPVHDQLLLMEELWDSISGHEVHEPLSESDQQQLAERLADDENNPEDVVSWEEIKSAALRRAGYFVGNVTHLLHLQRGWNPLQMSHL